MAQGISPVIGLSIILLEIPIKKWYLTFIKTVLPALGVAYCIFGQISYHAFPDYWQGKSELHISFHKKSKDEIDLTVKDNGIGMPEGIHLGDTQTLGLHLVYILVEDQLNGTIRMQRKGGTIFQILFTKS